MGQPDGLVRLIDGDSQLPDVSGARGPGMFANTVAFMQTRVPAEVNGTTQWTQAELANGDYHSALGVRAMLGRTLSSTDEHTRAPVAVLSHAFWTRAFSADPPYWEDHPD